MEFKAQDIAAFLKGEIEGDANVNVFNVSKIEDGKPGTLAFLANLKYENHIYNTKASVVLVNKTFEAKKEIAATLIRVEDAYQAFAALLEMYLHTKAGLKKGIEQPSFIDSSAKIGDDIFVGAFAYVGKNTQIGNRVKIYPQAYIGDNVSIGDDCIVYAGAKVYEETIIGNRCIINAGAIIGADGFGFAPQKDKSYKKIPQIGNVILEDDVDVGANTTIDCGTMGSTLIKKGVKIDNLVQIAHNCEIGENTAIAAQTGISGSTKIGKNCIIGGQVGFNGHITVGDNCIIGAQGGVTHSLKDNEMVWGTPAFNYKDALKSYASIKKLPQIRKDILQIQKDIESLKQTN